VHKIVKEIYVLVTGSTEPNDSENLDNKLAGWKTRRKTKAECI
jgi:hypothetical protein